MASVLIVGAGAIGVATGYHLALGGTDVAFLVRPQSRSRIEPPQRLYCYDDHTVKEFGNYRVITAAAEAAHSPFDFIFVTLDGYACRTPSGSELLRELGTATRNSGARLIIGGVGTGLFEHVQQLTGYPAERLMQGSLGNLCHQVANANMPLHPPTNAALLASAHFAYHHFSNRVGFSLCAAPKKDAREFAALYERCGISRCQLSPPWAYTIITNMFYPLFATSQLAGWPSAAQLAANKELWSLNCAAVNEIIALHVPGWIAPIIRLLVGEKALFKLFQGIERSSLPLDFHAFNRFHHGAKVLAQDVQIMQNSIALGESRGKPMSALKELLQRLRQHFDREGNAEAAALLDNRSRRV
jgi:Ketopantoate reductase PanE/ApbA